MERGGAEHSQPSGASGTTLDWARRGADWPNREASRFVTAGGLTFHVQVAGSGPVLLLLHGTGASTHSWRDVLPLLAPHVTVVAADLPGHAFTGTPAARRMSLPGMAAAIGQLLRAMQVSPQVAVGHSAGAAILARMCLDRTIAPAGLVSLNGALLPIGGIAGQVFSPLARVLASSSVASRLFSRWAGDPRVVGRVIDSTGSTLDARGLELYGRLAAEPRHTAGTLTMMANWDLAPLVRHLPGLRTPLFMVVGGRDQSVPPEDARRVRALVPGARIETLRDLGHLAHEEAPASVADLILRACREWGILPSVSS